MNVTESRSAEHTPRSSDDRAGSLLHWVPIRSLGARHRDRISTHLRTLNSEDRYLRFGYAAGDEQIDSYVASIDFEHDEVFGIFDRRLELVALAHLACSKGSPHASKPAAAEFGVSVLESARGQGYGARLFDHSIIHARNRGVEKLQIQALAENKRMLSIALKAGATFERDGNESLAWLRLPPDTLASQVEEVVGTHAAEVSYQLKRHALRFEQLISARSVVDREP